MTRWSAAALLGAVAVATACWAPAAAASPPSGSAELFVIPDPRITEASGLALSGRHEGVLWMHNDSGGEARLFGVGFDGGTVAVASFTDATNVDWEAMARGPDGTLWVGDIGDNDYAREDVSVYRISEPELGDTQVTPTRFVLSYPDGPRDAEALLVNPVTGRLWIATKEIYGGGLYEAPEQLSADSVNELVRIRDVPSVITDGTWSADGQQYVLRDYGQAWIYDPNGTALYQIELPGQDQGQNQGESVTYSPAGTALLSGSEQANSTIWEIPLSGAGPPTGTDSDGTEADGTGEATAGGTADGTDPDTGAGGNEGGIITDSDGDGDSDSGGPSGLAIAVAAAIATAFLVGRARRNRRGT